MEESVSSGDARTAGEAVLVQSTSAADDHCSIASRYKKVITAALVAILVVVVAAAVALSTRSNHNAANSGYDNAVVSNSKNDGIEPNESSEPVSNSDFIVTNLARQSTTFGASTCRTGEGLWNLVLVTDDYPWEIKWQLISGGQNGVVVASGPPEGRNYARRTKYTGSLCLLAGRYSMRWSDLMGDGICCNYGPGEWTVRVNDKVVLQSDPEDSSFTERYFKFDVKSGEEEGGIRGTFLLMPRPYEPVSNIELPDGRIFELANLPPDFDYSENGLVSGVTSITIPSDSEFLDNGEVLVKGEDPIAIGRRQLVDNSNYTQDGRHLRSARDMHRKLATFTGDFTVLAVRVIASGDETSADETALSNSIFGNGVDPDNLVSQFKACSYDKMRFNKAARRSGSSADSGEVSISNGVVTVSLPSIRTTQGHGKMRNAITDELNEIFSVASPTELADFVIICLPPRTPMPTSYARAYAYINSWLSIFDDNWCTSVSFQMHEVGHNLNFGHSNEEGVTYEDQSGAMGYAYPNNNGPRSCFNAAKSWQTGWYKDKGRTINFSSSTPCFDGILHGVADYPIADTVLLKVQNGSGNDYFVNFNAQKGINYGTQEGGNQVLVVTRPRGGRDTYAESELVAKLDAGESHSFLGYTISVGRIDKAAGTAEVFVLPTGQSECLI